MSLNPIPRINAAIVVPSPLGSTDQFDVILLDGDVGSRWPLRNAPHAECGDHINVVVEGGTANLWDVEALFWWLARELGGQSCGTNADWIDECVYLGGGEGGANMGPGGWYLLCRECGSEDVIELLRWDATDEEREERLASQHGVWGAEDAPADAARDIAMAVLREAHRAA